MSNPSVLDQMNIPCTKHMQKAQEILDNLHRIITELIVVGPQAEKRRAPTGGEAK